jgi:hypothetical protein
MSVTKSKEIGHTSIKENSNDIYSVFQNSINRYFSEVKGNTAEYLQAVTNLQQEIIEAREKNAKNAISLQKTIYKQVGMELNNSVSVMELAKSLGEQTTKSWNLQNQLMLKSLETLSKNIEAFNKNSAAFEEINKKLIDSWASIIKQAVRKEFVPNTSS